MTERGCALALGDTVLRELETQAPPPAGPSRPPHPPRQGERTGERAADLLRLPAPKQPSAGPLRAHWRIRSRDQSGQRGRWKPRATSSSARGHTSPTGTGCPCRSPRPRHPAAPSLVTSMGWPLFDWCVSGSLRPQFPSCDRCVCQQRIGAATSQLGGPRGLSGSARRCTHRGGPLQ